MILNRRYEILSLLGRGRSSVYLAKDKDLDDRVIAVKILDADDPFEKRSFKNEYDILSAFDHPNIIKVFSFGMAVDTSGNQNFDIKPASLFYTMEYFEGNSLAAVSGPLQPAVIENILAQLASFLYYLHQANFKYNDLKLENVLVNYSGGEPAIKVIDFGHTKYMDELIKETIAGTAYYLAPELLLKEPSDHRTDLYALGIVLYKLIYGVFPFDSANELDIYKEHLEKNFDFQLVPSYNKLISAAKNLLAKDPANRYYSSLEVFHELKIPINQQIYAYWVNPELFSNREDILKYVNEYLRMKKEGEILVIRGEEGSGKSALLRKIALSEKDIVYLSAGALTSDSESWKFHIKNILYGKAADRYSDEVRFLSDKLNSDNFNEVIQNIFSGIFTANGIAALLIDDLNLAEPFSREILKMAILQAQVSGLSVIITEDSGHKFLSEELNNVRVFNLTPFTEKEIKNFVESSFSSFFPREELTRIIVNNSDMAPGNVNFFIRDIISSGYIDYSGSAPVFKSAGAETFPERYVMVFSRRVFGLNSEAVEAAQLLSSLEIELTRQNVLNILKEVANDPEQTLKNLTGNNILRTDNSTLITYFTSGRLKEYIYSSVTKKERLHFKVATIFKQTFKDKFRTETARHFFLADCSEQAFIFIQKEIEEAKKRHNYIYIKKLLYQLLQYGLKENRLTSVKMQLSENLYILKEYKDCLEVCRELLDENISASEINIVRSRMAVSLIKTGLVNEGVRILEETLDRVEDKKQKSDFLVELAYAKLDLNYFDDAEKICQTLIDDQAVHKETKASAYNLLGLLEFYKNSNLEKTIEYFKTSLTGFEELGLSMRASGIKVNLGNIYNMSGDSREAERCWNGALQTNNTFLNIDQKAKLLLNYGVYHFERNEFEQAESDYLEARKVFRAAGDRYGEGLIHSNLAELYLESCSYQKAWDSLVKAKAVFGSLGNMEEEGEALFLQGIFGYRMQNLAMLKDALKAYEWALSQSSLHKTNYDFLVILLNEMEEPGTADFNSIKKIAEEYQNSGNRFRYTSVMLYLSKLLVEKNIDEASQVIFSEELEEAISGNKRFLAEKEYIAALYYKGKNSSFINNLENAYNYIVDESIYEITLLVIYELSRAYFDRGNFPEAEKYGNYASFLLEHIKESITDSKLNKMFLSRPGIMSIHNFLKDLFAEK